MKCQRVNQKYQFPLLNNYPLYFKIPKQLFIYLKLPKDTKNIYLWRIDNEVLESKSKMFQFQINFTFYLKIPKLLIILQ